MLDDACHGGVASPWAECAFQRYDDFPSDWASCSQRPTALCPCTSASYSRPSSYSLKLFTLLQTLYPLLILFKPLLNTLSHANSLQLNPFCTFFILVSSLRYLPPHPFVIRGFPFNSSTSSYSISTNAEDLFQSITKMSTIQNLKNFIRHGKQARVVDPPTTNVSPVHAQHQKHQGYGVSEPNAAYQHQQQQQQHPAEKLIDGTYSVGAIDNRNVAVQAAAAATQAQGKQQKVQAGGREADIQQIVAEEREKQGKLPKYPGLERYHLVAKMGDGAFSNVYRAKDLQHGGEVAIKVVRKFEMNSNQVCPTVGTTHFSFFLPRLSPL